MTVSEPAVSDTVLVRHPVRGLLWGLMLGIGLSAMLVFSTLIEFALGPILITIVVSALGGVAWGLIGPPKPPPEQDASTFTSRDQITPRR